jgi:hypothetical protein
VVFPRRSGVIDTSVWIEAGGAPRDLGVVRYVGDPTQAALLYDPAVDEVDGANNQQGIDEADGDNNQCGVDEPDGDNNQEGADGEDAVDATLEGAVADHNLPAAIGC